MKNILIKSVLIATFTCTGVFILSTENVSALTWTSDVLPDLGYFWNCGDGLVNCSGANGWSPGLSGALVTINYNAQVKNLDTNTLLNSGQNVPVGTHLKFEAVPFNDTDISWFGTGYGNDSPYGHWINNANAPAKQCDPADYVTTSSGILNPSFGGFGVYIPLSVNQSTVSYDHTGSTAGLSCSGNGQTCTVTSPGSIVGNVTFGNTYGKFYYRYLPNALAAANGWGWGCTANNVALRQGDIEEELMTINGVDTGLSFLTFYFPDHSLPLMNSSYYPGSDYTLSIPAQTISLTLTAGNASTPTIDLYFSFLDTIKSSLQKITTLFHTTEQTGRVFAAGERR